MTNAQILEALTLRRNQKMAISAIRLHIYEKHGIDVPQSTMQKRLAKYADCNSVEEIEKAQEEAASRKKNKTSNGNSKPAAKKASSKKINPAVIILGNKILDTMILNVDAAIMQTDMTLSITDLANVDEIDVKSLATLMQDSEEYVINQLRKAKRKIESSAPKAQETTLPEKGSDKKPEPIELPAESKPIENMSEIKIPNPEEKPDIPEQEQIENTIHSRYGFGDDPKEIAQDLNMELEDVKKILNIEAHPPEELTNIENQPSF